MASTWTRTILEPPSKPGPVRRIAGRLGVVAVGFALAVAGGVGGPKGAADRRVAVADYLRDRGLVAEPDDVVFLDGPKGVLQAAFGTSRVLVRAQSAEGEPRDVYLFDARLSPAGVLLGLGRGHNLSDTIGADESRPVAAGGVVAYASNSVVEGAPSVVTVLDFAGQPPVDWPAFERMQLALTNWQLTGQLGGVGRRTYVVDGEGEVGLAALHGRILVASAGRTAALPASPTEAPAEPWMIAEPTELARPGNLVTWSVDRVRFEIGDENMQAIKQAAFTALDFFEKNRQEITGDTGEDDIAESLGEDSLAPPREIPVDPDLGWPPPPLEPLIKPTLKGEGQWNAKDDPAFFRSQPGLPPVFLTTFIRPDLSRRAATVFIALWDPRRVELHMMAGTVEPKGATGKAGPGLIPRTPDMMKRLVAASNAGFQALHGEYGMMADGTVYLPPKPYAATVLKLRDGTTAFGTWPDSATVPDQVVSYRQNMTVMVQDEKFNPFERTWWGGAVPGAEDKVHTVRTGMCLTREGFVAFFYGADLSPDALAQAMISARCSYGLALDMNAGHSGLEFYNVAPEAELPPIKRALSGKWEAEDEVPYMPGWRFRAKTLIHGMGLMNFPRYIKREARDFFYLTLRHVLPGPNLPPPVSPVLEGEGEWRTKGLPQHGFPYALALTEIRPDPADAGTKFRVVQIDPRTVALGAADDERKTVAYVSPRARVEQAGGKTLWLAAGGFSIAADAPPGRASALAQGVSEPGKGAAVACVHAESGMLYYAEVDGAGEGKRSPLGPMAELLAKVGCTESLALAEPIGVVLGDGNALSGKQGVITKSSLRLVRALAPGGARFFEDTPIVPRNVWYPLQQHRVRYFKKRDE